jgi:hypothetical protein
LVGWFSVVRLVYYDAQGPNVIWTLSHGLNGRGKIQMTLFPLTPDGTQDKTALLKYFRERGNERLAELRIEVGNINYKGLASRLNKAVVYLPQPCTSL